MSKSPKWGSDETAVDCATIFDPSTRKIEFTATKEEYIAGTRTPGVITVSICAITDDAKNNVPELLTGQTC